MTTIGGSSLREKNGAKLASAGKIETSHDARAWWTTPAGMLVNAVVISRSHPDVYREMV